LITKNISDAIKELNKGNIIGLPTETVYGLAGNALNEEAIKKIFNLKKRPFYNPLIVHIKSIDYLHEIATDIPDIALKLANVFWPGPLTLILNKKAIVPDIVTGGKDTVAVRVPNHPIALSLLQEIDFPLAAPSANPFGSISPTNANHVYSYFKETLPIILDGDVSKSGIESTIVGFDKEDVIIYRFGSLSREAIVEVVGEVKVLNEDNESPIAPGMLSRHYAPEKDTFVTFDIIKFLSEATSKKIGLLSFNEEIEHPSIIHQEILSKRGNLEEAATNFYAALHRLDKSNIDIIVASYFPHEGIGIALNDKLKRATKKE
jgi:L-threonylcarbamoyladenylate synthase